MNPGGSHPFLRLILGWCIRLNYMPHRPWFRRLVRQNLVKLNVREPDAFIFQMPGHGDQGDVERFQRWWRDDYAQTR